MSAAPEGRTSGRPIRSDDWTEAPVLQEHHPSRLERGTRLPVSTDRRPQRSAPDDPPIAQVVDGEVSGLSVIDPAKLNSVRKVKPRIRAYLRRAIRDHTERERALSDVLNEILAMELDGDIDIWQSVLRILRRIAREEWHRRRQVEADSAVVRLVADSGGNERRAYRLALWAWEDAAMEHLTDVQRGALELHVMDGLTDAQIAALLHCSPGSVRVLRATAKRRLRNLIESGAIPAPPKRVDWPRSLTCSDPLE